MSNMMRNLTTTFLAITGVTVVSARSNHLSAQGMAMGKETTMGMMGEMAPNAAAVTLDGKPVELSQYLGKGPVVLEFWATWCPLCKQLEPQMEAAKKAHGDKVTFIAVGVPQNQTPEKQKAYVTGQKLGGRYIFDKDGSVYKAYKATHTSYLVVINAAGRVVYTGQGGDQNVEEAIAKAMPVGREF